MPGCLLRPEKYHSYTYTAGDPVNNSDSAGTDIQGCLAGLGSGAVSFGGLEALFGSAALAEAVSAG